MGGIISIWLGYPDESSEDGSGTDNVQSLIDEIQAKDQEIDQIQDELITELKNSDTELKRTEKEEFVSEAELTSDGRAKSGTGIKSITVSDDTTWTEILNSYFRAWGSDSGAKKDSLDEKVNKIKQVMDNEWAYGNKRVPYGMISIDTKLRVEDGYKGEIKTKIDSAADAILELHNKMAELESALENERAEIEGGGGGAGGGGNQNILEAVRNMKAIKINTVTNVVTNDNRWLVEHQIPGRAGVDSEVSSSVIQDLGRRPASMSFKGVLTADSEDRQALHKKIETLKWFYRQRKPMFFATQLINQLESPKVVIEKIVFDENTDSPYAVKFNCTLKEYSDVDWTKNADQTHSKLQLHTQHWAEYQALKAMLIYKNNFIEPKEPVTNTLVAQRIANYVLGMNGQIKYLSTVGSARPSDLGMPEGVKELKIDIEIDKDDPTAQDDIVTLTSSDGEYNVTLKISEDGIEEEDGFTTLVYRNVPKGKQYNLEVDTGENKYFLYKNKSI